MTDGIVTTEGHGGVRESYDDGTTNMPPKERELRDMADRVAEYALDGETGSPHGDGELGQADAKARDEGWAGIEAKRVAEELAAEMREQGAREDEIMATLQEIAGRTLDEEEASERGEAPPDDAYDSDGDEEAEEAAEDADSPVYDYHDLINQLGDAQIRLKVDGEYVTVTADELANGWVGQATTTKRFQELAQERRALETERAQAGQLAAEVAQRLDLTRQVLTQAGASPQLLQQLDMVYAEQAQRAEALREAQLAQMVEQGRKVLTESLPGWDNPEKARADRRDMLEYGRELGYADDDLARLADHRLARVLWEAVQYRKLQAQQPELQKKLSHVPVLKPGQPRKVSTKTKAQRKARDSARQRLRRTGRESDAAELILHSGLLDDV